MLKIYEGWWLGSRLLVVIWVGKIIIGKLCI